MAHTTGKLCGSKVGLMIVMGALYAVIATPPAQAQAFGTISGNITDPTGAAVPEATVTASEAGTGFTRTVKADASGHFVIPNLRPTQYNLTVEAKGFRKFTQTGVVLLANQAATVNARLELGSSVQTVTVEANAAMVNTTNATLNNVIGQARIVDLP